MEKQTLVSVIIPVYNAEKTIGRLLDCLTSQTLEDIAIICVDDGSADDSAAIIQAHAEKDARIAYIRQENSGAGAARNTGMACAKGKYLAFLDADDFFERDMLERAVRRAEADGLDVTVFRSDEYDEATGRYMPTPWTVRKHMLPGKRAFSMREVRRDRFRAFSGWAWDKLFLRSFVEENGLRFQSLRICNDVRFVMSALMRAERVGVMDEVLAHHTMRADSLQGTRARSLECVYEARLALKEQLQAWGYWPWLERDFVNYAAFVLLFNLRALPQDVRGAYRRKLGEEYLPALGVTGRRRAYFYHGDEYDDLMRVLPPDSPGYAPAPGAVRLAGRLMRALRYVRGHGVSHTMRRLGERAARGKQS